MSQTPTMLELAAEARTVQAKLEQLWADEGVEQLTIFLDPEIVVVLEEIKQVSMDFVEQIAALSSVD
ncbi:MAG TPA: hypothetical protein G4N94_05875 [Caldilineae bacterium]|nr:hypothetical protein [Caldilineae bacterium]